MHVARGTFNGATAFRRWKLVRSSPPARALSTFNGATAFRRWKRVPAQVRPGGTSSVPSMGPPPFGDGNCTRGPCKYYHAFNGATAFRRWKRERREVHRAIDTIGPSMGPPPFKHPAGHRLSAMEPSMGPPPFGDGNGLGMPERFSGHSVPSMGPPPFGDGNGDFGGLHQRVHGHPFNGATAFRRWKLGAYRVQPAFQVYFRPFNGATAFRRWKQPLPALTACRNDTPFNGATAFRRWKLGCLVREARFSSFNGATAFRRWKPLFVARLRHGFIQKRVFPQEPVTG